MNPIEGQGIGGANKENDEVQLKMLKNLRVEIDALIQGCGALFGSREVSLVITKLDEARMWAGKACGIYNGEAFRKSEFGDPAESPKEL